MPNLSFQHFNGLAQEVYEILSPYGPRRACGHVDVGTNISSVVEFQRWWVLKSKIFGQESTYSKEIFFNNPLMNYSLSKSANIILSKSIFNVKNQVIFFI